MSKKSTSSFNEWFAAGNIPINQNGIRELIQILKSDQPRGNYGRSERNGIWFIYGPGEKTLVLGSENARNAFKKILNYHLKHPAADWVDDPAIEIVPTVIRPKEIPHTLEKFFED